MFLRSDAVIFRAQSGLFHSDVRNVASTCFDSRAKARLRQQLLFQSTINIHDAFYVSFTLSETHVGAHDAPARLPLDNDRPDCSQKNVPPNAGGKATKSTRGRRTGAP